MNKDQSKQLINDLSQRLREGEDFYKIQLQLPTDLFEWDNVIELMNEWTDNRKFFNSEENCTVENNKNECQTPFFDCKNSPNPVENSTLEHGSSKESFDFTYSIVLVLWIENLLKNPFELTKVIDKSQVQTLKWFLLSQLKNIKIFNYKKIMLRCLSFLASHLYKDCIETGDQRNNNNQIEFCSSDNPQSGKQKMGFIGIDNEFICHSSDELFFIFNSQVSIVDFYCFLKYFSKLKKFNRQFLKFLDSDTVQIKRYKIKIISFITERDTVINDINCLLQWINSDNTKLGWTISKSIYRMSRLVNKKTLINSLKDLLSESICAEEQLWINVMSILSFLVLEGENLGRIQFIERALCYENEFYSKRTQLKETALFLLWTLVRSGLFYENKRDKESIDKNFNINGASDHIEHSTDHRIDTLDFCMNQESIDEFDLKLNLFQSSAIANRVVFIALFDVDFITRRAAASVVQELVGRTKIFKNEPAIFKITPENIKRRKQSLEIFDEMAGKEKYFEFFENLLYSYDRETREIGACLISKYLDLAKLRMRYQSSVEMDGIHILIKCMLSTDPKNLCSCRESNTLKTIKNEVHIQDTEDPQNNKNSFNSHKEFFENTLSTFILNNQNYKHRNMHLACKSYLEISEYFYQLNNTKENILFLASKGFSAFDLFKASKVYFDDPVFSKKILDSFNKNSSFILMNSNNFLFKELVIGKNIKNIKEGKFVDVCIYALQLLKAYDVPIQIELSGFLDDYSISYNGDVGYFNRRASLEYFCALNEDNGKDCDNKSCNNSTDSCFKSIVNVENYLIRFLCDKSRKLRDDVLKALLSTEFPHFKTLFPFIDFSSFSCKNISKRTSIFENFFISFSCLVQDFDYETAYLKALFKAFMLKDDFYLGINHMFESADSRLLKILKAEIEVHKSQFYSWGKCTGKLLEFINTLEL